MILGCLTYAYVRDVKLELRAKKCIFLEYTIRVKHYKLWFIDKKTPGLIINRDVTFNESATSANQKETTIAKTDHGASDRIKLEIESPLDYSNSLDVEKVKNINQEDNFDAPVQQQQLYSIATSRKNRVINRSKRFANVVNENLLGYANFLKFSLLFAKTIGVLDPSNSKEAIYISRRDR
ncbi:hypothetical protein FXO38_11188 [Capsicum annuum]|uniref:Retroviral polymerase SH3-like domain-containing protein n=1 Tax=Capsicum annuum TaxID=4072 RepID=A0A2G2YEI3_CAPAN|nr:hypothetical protein FXO38_11188 [Capsicum annuum]KAF3674129.1 hypothetical protein FXO37_06548 [Capsicum annuum]PHT68109.1 hypothetical protein T459_27596 [Capsicum annuum]